MRSQPAHLDEAAIQALVNEGWSLRFDAWRYFPEGGGAYHWIGDTGAHGPRWFVTCDDLDTKPWLGSDRDRVFANLLAAYATAWHLRTQAGLPFVVAPVPAASGALALRLDDRHSVAVFAHVDGEPGRWGTAIPGVTRTEVVTMLARLHGTTPAAGTPARPGLDVPDRPALEDALDHVGTRWDGGPLSNAARSRLAAHAGLVRQWLDDLDQSAGQLGGSGGEPVVTHGEPHPGNLIRMPAGQALVDWDTVARARPERDLWMLDDGSGSVIITYRELTGVSVDASALRAYRLLWAVNDVAAFIVQLRGEHRRDRDAERALVALDLIFSGREPAPYGPPVVTGRR